MLMMCTCMQKCAEVLQKPVLTTAGLWQASSGLVGSQHGDKSGYAQQA